MAENIYIGNRYVVKYMGNWDDTVQYESLSAVLYGGNAYVSNKPVPAGTLPTVTDYWAFWGSGNAVIDALSTRVTAIETRTGNLETRTDAIETDVLGLASRLTIAEGNIDIAFADINTNKQSISDLQNVITQMQNDISTIQSDLPNFERTANKNAANGYMGLSSGYATRPNLYASPLIMTANILTAQSITSGTQIVRFNNVLASTQVGLVEQISLNLSGANAGTFTVLGSGNYDVWVSASILCIPTGNTGIKDIYLHYNNEARFATEAYFPTGATRVSIQIPEVYMGTVSGGSGQFGITCTNWTAGDAIGQGSIIGDNYGSTWISIKAYRRYLPV